MKMVINEIKDSYPDFASKYHLDHYTTLYYDKIEYEVQRDVDSFDTYTIYDFEYNAETDEIFDWLIDHAEILEGDRKLFIENGDDGFMEYDEWCDYIGSHYEELVKYYNKELLEYFESDAYDYLDKYYYDYIPNESDEEFYAR